MKFFVIGSSNVYMKKILLLSAILLGAVSASNAGVRFSFGLPLPPLPSIRIGPPAVVVDPTPAVPYYAPECDAPVVVAPPAVEFGFGYRDYIRGITRIITRGTTATGIMAAIHTRIIMKIMVVAIGAGK